MNRRDILTGLAGIFAAGFAPAAVGSGVLMPVRRVDAVEWECFAAGHSYPEKACVASLWMPLGITPSPQNVIALLRPLTTPDRWLNSSDAMASARGKNLSGVIAMAFQIPHPA